MKPRILAQGKYSADQLMMLKDHSSTRKSTAVIEQKITDTWQYMQNKARDNSLLLFNGQGLRLDHLETTTNGVLVLHVSQIDYKTRRSLELLINEIEEYGEDFYSKGLAVGGLVKTNDNFYIFGSRSGKTMSNNTIDILGGVVDDTIEITFAGLATMLHQELSEEANILPESIESDIFLGIIMSHNGNCVVIYDVTLNLSRTQIERNFTNNDNVEMKELLFVRKDELDSYLKKLGGYKALIPALLLH